MSYPLFGVALFSLVPVGATLLGAVYAAARPPGAALRSLLQHFAAGVVFSVVAVELLPDVIRTHDVVEISWTFALGVALMLGIRRATATMDRETPIAIAEGGTAAPSPGQLVAVGVDILIDGLLVGIAFAAGDKQGMLLTGALSLELLSLSLAVASGLGASGRGRVRTILVPTGLSLLLPVGALIGDTVLRGASEHFLAGLLSFGSAALLFLVTEELLVEAHEAPETTLATSMFFAGFLLFMVLGMLG